MSANITFTEDQITGLFGELAAEDEDIERFKSSFFKSATYEKIHNDRPLRILVAHKGVGKSALFRMSYEENIANIYYHCGSVRMILQICVKCRMQKVR